MDYAQRKLDGKFSLRATQDGIEIYKSSNNEVVPLDEPVILFRGRDRLALPTLRRYKTLCEEDGCTAYQLEVLDEVIELFEDFACSHPDQMKQPGITQGK